MSEGPDLHAELERQRTLVEASYALHTSLDLDEVLGLILDAALEGVRAERGTVYLLVEDGTELWARVRSGAEAVEIRLPVGQGIAGAVAVDGRTLRIDDAYADPRFDPDWDRRTGYRTRQILCAPVRNRDGAIVGVFQLLNKREGQFTAADEDYLRALSVHAALAVENARLHASALEKERYDREVRLARGVQRQLQPERRALARGSIAVAGLNELCEDASGDYYDLLEDLPDGRLGVVIGDVSGHGLQAALVMAEARALLRAFLHASTGLAETLARMNEFLVPDLAEGRFLSLFAGLLDPWTGALAWCSAGHAPPLLYRAATRTVGALPARGLVLGAFPGVAYEAGPAQALATGDVLLLYTDGVTEARAPGGEPFGERRLGEVLREATREPPDGIACAVRGAVARWTAGAPLEDDLTLVVVRRAGAP